MSVVPYARGAGRSRPGGRARTAGRPACRWGKSGLLRARCWVTPRRG